MPFSPLPSRVWRLKTSKPVLRSWSEVQMRPTRSGGNDDEESDSLLEAREYIEARLVEQEGSVDEARLAEISRDDKRRAAPQEARTILHGHVWFGSQLSGMGELLDGEVRETSGTRPAWPEGTYTPRNSDCLAAGAAEGRRRVQTRSLKKRLEIFTLVEGRYR